MPSEFPIEHYETIHKRIKKFVYKCPKSWKQYSGAWNAVAYRFKACAKHNIIFTDSVIRAGNTPKASERYIQEKELFNFFVTGLSVIESLLYGLYSIVSIVKPDCFPITKQGHLRGINPKKTSENLNCAFPEEEISKKIKMLVESKDFIEWSDIRNILAHRASPGREIHVGGELNSKAFWIQGIQINENATASKFKWLTCTILNIMEEIDDFTFKMFKNPSNENKSS